MKMLRILTIFLLFYSSGSNSAESTKSWRIDELNFTKWMDNREYSSFMIQIPEGKYPMIIQVQPLVGDGAAFRVLLNQKPNKAFQYRTECCIRDDKYEAINADQIKKGYVLIYHDYVYLLPGKIHQATWVKN